MLAVGRIARSLAARARGANDALARHRSTLGRRVTGS